MRLHSHNHRLTHQSKAVAKSLMDTASQQHAQAIHAACVQQAFRVAHGTHSRLQMPRTLNCNNAQCDLLGQQEAAKAAAVMGSGECQAYKLHPSRSTQHDAMHVWWCPGPDLNGVRAPSAALHCWVQSSRPPLSSHPISTCAWQRHSSVPCIPNKAPAVLLDGSMWTRMLPCCQQIDPACPSGIPPGTAHFPQVQWWC